MTEVPQATAREEAVDAIAAILQWHWPLVPGMVNTAALRFSADEAQRILDALLSPRTVPCATCGGTRNKPREVAGRMIPSDCPDCSDGSVTLGPLAVLVGELEQVAWLGPYGVIPGGVDNDPAPNWQPLFRAPFIEAQREEA